MKNEKVLRLFTYQGNQIRTVLKDEEPWWVASDVCKILGRGNVGMAVNSNEKTGNSGLDEDEKDDIRIPDAVGRQQRTLCVNESGLYSLIFKSCKVRLTRFWGDSNVEVESKDW